MNNSTKNYWIWQLAGWGGLGLFSLSIAASFDYIKPNYVLVVVTFLLTGLAITHAMREYILRKGVFNLTIQRQVYIMVLLSICAAAVATVINIGVEFLIGYDNENEKKYSILERIVLGILNNYFIFFVWNLIYFVYHHIQRNRKREMDNLRLESLVKELELKTIKSHINPHFIFNSLNSIRALVDENPQRARTAITELSKILRSSLKVEQNETASLASELDIVKDYLALEKLRFEERLSVHYNIDPATLNETLPPMMLQTLVENAIKHGISKKIEGGFVEISSHINEGNLAITVKNAGVLEPTTSADGFGIRGTRERLNYLYNGFASFNIRQLPDEIVETTVNIPIKISHKVPVYV